MNIFLAALITNVGVYLLGYIWYSRYLFHKPYMDALSKYSTARPYPRLIVFSLFFVFSYLGLLIMAYFITTLHISSFWEGARIGLYLWILYAAIEFCNTLFNRTNLTVALINWSYWLLSLVTAGGLMALWIE